MKYPARLVLIGDPISHSLSPVMQNAALSAAKIPLAYEAVRVDEADLGRFLTEMRKVGGAGNVTIPHKTSVMVVSDEMTHTVARAQACNAFKCIDGRMSVDNTDVAAFDLVARKLLNGKTTNAMVVLLGAGGAARAVLTAIESWRGARVSLVNRHAERVEGLEKMFAGFTKVEAEPENALARADLVINATPVGQHDDDEPCDIGSLGKAAAVFDLVYRQGQTPWIRRAVTAGHRAVDGMPMLLEQGALAFRFWFGMEPDREAMKRALA